MTSQRTRARVHNLRVQRKTAATVTTVTTFVGNVIVVGGGLIVIPSCMMHIMAHTYPLLLLSFSFSFIFIIFIVFSIQQMNIFSIVLYLYAVHT